MGGGHAEWPGDRTWIEVDVLKRGLWAGWKDFGASYDFFYASIDAETPEQRAHLVMLGPGHTPEGALSTPQQCFLPFYTIDPWLFCRTPALNAFLRAWDVCFTIDLVTSCINSMPCGVFVMQFTFKTENGDAKLAFGHIQNVRLLPPCLHPVSRFMVRVL